MPNEQFTAGWKAFVAVTAVVAAAGLGMGLTGSTPTLGGGNDTRLKAAEERISELESRLREYQATGGGKKAKDPSYGE